MFGELDSDLHVKKDSDIATEKTKHKKFYRVLYYSMYTMFLLGSLIITKRNMLVSTLFDNMPHEGCGLMSRSSSEASQASIKDMVCHVPHAHAGAGGYASLCQAGRRIWPWYRRALPVPTPMASGGGLAQQSSSKAGSGRCGMEWWEDNVRG